MPKQPAPVQILDDETIDALMAHPYWESLGDDLDALIAQVPQESDTPERTTVLSWIYLSHGSMSFLEISERITAGGSVTAAKKALRACLRRMQALVLVKIVNFPDEKDPATPADPEGVIGKNSLVSLTWTGMVWMRRAWLTRARLATARPLVHVHRQLVHEEDAGHGNDPFWVENLRSADPEGPAKRAQRIAKVMPSITSIFDLAKAQKRR